MSEAAMWEAIRPILKKLDPVRIESHLTGGVPDVNYTVGWIELKYAERWPPRAGPLRIDHFTPGQRSWHIRRRKAGGLSFVLLKVGESEWLLFDGAIAAIKLGREVQDVLYKSCKARWTRLPRTEEMIPWLK